jgi:hypothetical protein
MDFTTSVSYAKIPPGRMQVMARSKIEIQIHDLLESSAENGKPSNQGKLQAI